MSDRREAVQRFLWLALPVVLAFALYLPSLGHGLVLDDRNLIVENPYLTRADGWLDLVSHDVWGASGSGRSTQYYRPLPMLTFWLQVQALGGAVAWLRLGNVALLGACAAMLVALLSRQWPGLSPRAVSLVACAWVAHPFNTEATIWLPGRFDLFLLLGALGTLTLNLTATRRWSVPLVFAGSLLCKEPAIVLLPVLLLQDFFGKRGFKDEAFKVLGLLAVVMGYFLLRHAVGVASAMQAVQAKPMLSLVQSYSALLAVFGRLLLLPLGFDVQHWYEPLPWSQTIVLIAAAIAGGCLAFRRAFLDATRGGLAVGIALSLLSLAPVALIGPNQLTYGDRFASLFVLGLAVASPYFSIATSSILKMAGPVLVVMLIAVWSLLSLLRGREWSSEQQLMTSALRDEEQHPFWRVMHGHHLLERGDPPAAIEVLSGVTLSHPGYYKAWNALCVGYLRSGQTERAHQACQRAVELDAQSHSVWLNWASVLAHERRWQEAIEAAQKALQLRPSYASAEYVIAVSLANLGQLEAAEQHVRRGLTSEPSDVPLNDLKRQLERRRAQ